MKLLIASDIHGSAFWCERLAEAYHREGADRMLLLGDILYHGPRNDLPEGYDPKAVIRMLNELKDRIFCVRGNCDTEVDQMVLDFPIMAEYAVFEEKSRLIYASHGHHPVEKLLSGDILLCGHTHIPACEERDGCMILNPGSVSIPKNGTPHGYMTLSDGEFLWKELNGGVYRQYRL